MQEKYLKLKSYCDEKIKQFPQYQSKYNREIRLAKRYYDNGVNLITILKKDKDKISTRYIIPFLLGINKEVTNEDFEFKLVKEGSSGGVDIDMDFSSEGKEIIKKYLLDKYGEDKVISVGTFSMMGPASAAKDLLRVYEIDFQKSNSFTKLLKKEVSWEDNLKNIEQNYPNQYAFYLENKEVLDLVPYFLNKTRQSGKHAGGIVITNEKFEDLIPTNRVGGAAGEVVTAFQESAQEQVLDELGIIKYDLLAIKILDILKNAVNLIDEDLYLIEENGTKKIVPESYLDKSLIK